MNIASNIALSCLIALSVSLVNSYAQARTWTCNANIALSGTQFNITEVPWTMSGGMTVDREKACKDAIKNNWLNNGYIWRQLVNSGQLSTVNVTNYCGVGALFVVRYGFDARAKDWQFQQKVYPQCIYPCSQIFPSN